MTTETDSRTESAANKAPQGVMEARGGAQPAIDAAQASVQARVEALAAGLGDPRALEALAGDISRLAREVDRIAAEAAEARRAEATFRSIFENATVGIFQTTADGHYLSCNPALATIYGYASPEELKASVKDITRQLYVEDTTRPRFVALMQEHDRVTEFEARIHRKDGQIIWISESARAVRNPAGQLLYYEGFVTDISRRRQAEEQLLHDALHDGLTGMPNRALFKDRLERAIARGVRDPEHNYAVLFVDLDRFKVVNDSLGHATGDRLLIEAAARISKCLRAIDTVARLGGDEFTILLDDPRDPDNAEAVAGRILASLAKPFLLDGHEIFVSASIGIALGGPAYHRPQEVMRDADTAMYRAKSLGRNRHQVFDAPMHTRAMNLMQLENDLRRAIDRNEFRLHYQPILSIGTGKLKGFEALVRWVHPQRGIISPAEFIPVAEETGLILTLGQWVLREACRQTAEWHRQFPDSPVDINVNLSGRQLGQKDLVERVMAALAETGLPARHLILEITESVVMDNPEASIEMFGRLKALGIQLNIDDFGTGYSSLAYLQRLPVDTMKIDRSFIARLGNSPESAEIVRTIVALAHSLNMKVTAEGIETSEQLEKLAALECENAQGFLFSRPLDGPGATKLLLPR